MAVAGLALWVVLALGAEVEHHHHPHGVPEPENAAPASDGATSNAATPEPSADEPSIHERMMEAMTGPLDIPLQQGASGTAWQPASTPMLGHMFLAGSWSFMLHYNLSAGIDIQGSQRGSTQGFTTNWVMAMAQAPFVGGRFFARVMLSAEAPFMGPTGYPLLLQTGETANGAPLVDRQHPHDLFMELAVKYTHSLGPHFAFEVYLAAAGEPALGPVAFPHRFSASDDPLAPISHHWQDSSHISFGVVTGAFYMRYLKLEVSGFNGREPDENRYNLDLRLPDSYSFRLSANPSRDWSVQASYGYLREPEPLLAPGESQQRITASVTYNHRWNDGNWATTLVFGQDRVQNQAPGSSVLLESDLWFHNDSFFFRAEYVGKTGHDFALAEEDAHSRIHVAAFGVGYVRHFPTAAGLVPGVGIRLGGNVVGGPVASQYGAFPMGFIVFVQLRPVEMMGDMMHHHMSAPGS